MTRLPERLTTARLVLRVPDVADAPALNAAVAESFPELHPWMPWAAEPQTLAQTEEFCRTARAEWLDELRYAVLLLRADDGTLVGASGYPNIDWQVPKFEIGYWCRTSQVGGGFVSEATSALARLAFETFRAARVELRMDDRNERSWRVAERLGFTLEGVLHADERDHAGGLRNTRVYARLSADGLG